jgi:hypothetical protein
VKHICERDSEDNNGVNEKFDIKDAGKFWIFNGRMLLCEYEVYTCPKCGKKLSEKEYERE